MSTMRSVFAFPLRLLAFWLLFFVIFRVWFIAWFHGEWQPGNPWSAWQALWYALPLDLSMAAYLMTVPVLLWFAGLAIGKRSWDTLEKSISRFNIAVFAVLILVFGANVFIYEEWHTPLNSRALKYMSTPWALLDSMSLPFKSAAVGLYTLFTWLMWHLYRRVVGLTIYPSDTPRWGLLVLPVHTGLLLLAIRGGLGVIPINESAVYYSPHLFNNHAATNASWSLIHSLLEVRSPLNHYSFMEEKEATERTECLLGGCSPWDVGSVKFFDGPDTVRQNLVFIVMESHTAQVVEELGGHPGVCPNLSRLIREGVLFENIYSSGYRTDQGLVSILAGYPAQPDQSIVLQTDKAAKLNSLPRILKGKGYSNAFFYGGELTFANIGAWLTSQQFEKIFSQKDFSRSDKTQRWGVDDQRMLQRAAEEMGKLPEPFFATALTLSLHPPFDVPYTGVWTGNSESDKFLNSAAFADQAIGEFFRTAEKQPWYDHTIFVLVADHGSSNPDRVGLDNPRSRHIPLIFFGKPLSKEWRGKRMSIYGNHHDIPATVLGLWKWEAKDLHWSRNLWDFDLLVDGFPVPAEFAFYTNESGLGWANSQGRGFYQFGNQEWYIWAGRLDSSAQKDAKAYLQTLYSDFLAR